MGANKKPLNAVRMQSKINLLKFYGGLSRNCFIGQLAAFGQLSAIAIVIAGCIARRCIHQSTNWIKRLVINETAKLHFLAKQTPHIDWTKILHPWVKQPKPDELGSKRNSFHTCLKTKLLKNHPKTCFEWNWETRILFFIRFLASGQNSKIASNFPAGLLKYFSNKSDFVDCEIFWWFIDLKK